MAYTIRLTNMRYGELTYSEIRDRAEAGWLAVIPLGSIEQQGPHLPVDFDTWFVQTLTETAADLAAREYDVNALVLPAIPFGPTAEHRNFRSGFVHLPAKLHHALVYAVLRSICEQGFTRLVLWNGYSSHDLNDVITQFNAEHAGRANVFLPNMPYQTIWSEVGDPEIPGGHADSFTTSLALFLRPEAVRSDRIAAPRNKPVNWRDPRLDLARHTNTGVVGDPTHASAELGQRLWDATVQMAALLLRDAAQISLSA
jgi:creatinine amidohydrolase